MTQKAAENPLLCCFHADEVASFFHQGNNIDWKISMRETGLGKNYEIANRNGSLTKLLNVQQSRTMCLLC